MGRLHLVVGTRYEREGRTCVVVQVLRDGRLVVEDQSGGGQEVVTREDLTRAWGGGVLRFAVGGLGVRAAGAGALPTRYTIADFHLLPERERAEAWRRYTLIRRLLTWPAGARTQRAIEEYLSTLSGARAPAGGEGAAAGEGGRSRPSVERYLRAFEASGGDIRALVPATTRGDAGGPRGRSARRRGRPCAVVVVVVCDNREGNDRAHALSRLGRPWRGRWLRPSSLVAPRAGRLPLLLPT